MTHSCGGETAVIDSRPGCDDGNYYIRRRRRCETCSEKFTTVELALVGPTHGKRLAAQAVANVDIGAQALDELREIRDRVQALISTMAGV